MSVAKTVDVQTRRSHRDLRGELRDRYIAAGGYDRVRADQLDPAEELLRYLARVQRRDGDRILRSIPQIARGLGWAAEGLSTRQVRDLQENRITRALAFLQVAGYIERVERDLRHANGEGIGIVMHLPAGVAQSVRAAGSYRRPIPRGGRQPCRASFGGRVSPPLREPLRRACDVPFSGTDQSDKAAARASALGTRARAVRRPSVRAALERALSAIGDERGGAGALEAAPELALEPLELVAREVWFATGRRDGRLSVRGAGRLARASSQLERAGYGGLTGPAAPRAALIDLALGDWQDAGAGWVVRTGSPAPVTVGGLVECLRKVARREAAAAKRRRRARADG